MTLRYAALASPTLRAAYDQAIGKVRKALPIAPLGQLTEDVGQQRPIRGDEAELLIRSMIANSFLWFAMCTNKKSAILFVADYCKVKIV
jgi:hypothetical protein